MAVQTDTSDVLQAAGPYDRARALSAFKLGDISFYWITRLSAISVLLILGGIIISLIIGALPAIRPTSPPTSPKVSHALPNPVASAS